MGRRCLMGRRPVRGAALMTKSSRPNLMKKEDDFPKAVLQGQSEPDVRFCKTGLSRAGKIF